MLYVQFLQDMEFLRSSEVTMDHNVSQEMSEFSKAYGFKQVTSSPHYPKSNGLAERTVQTTKAMLEKSKDPHLALLSHRATALQWCGLSPAELLMGRWIRTT